MDAEAAAADQVRVASAAASGFRCTMASCSSTGRGATHVKPLIVHLFPVTPTAVGNAKAEDELKHGTTCGGGVWCGCGCAGGGMVWC